MTMPGPTASVDELEAEPLPALDGFIIGTDIQGRVIHINLGHVEMIVTGPNYNTFAMQSGRNLQIVSLEPVP